MRTKEHGKKVSQGLMGHLVSKETRQKIRESNLGKVRSEETCKKIGESRKGKLPWNFGKQYSKEIRQKLSDAHKGQVPWNKGLRGVQTPWIKGKHHSEESKTKMKLSHKGKVFSEIHKKNIGKALKGLFVGKMASGWRGGISKENEIMRKRVDFRQWREAVYKRDDYTDQKYGTRGGNIHPHHILNFAEYPNIRFDPNNGITLSKQSHREFHKKYGFKNNTREQLEEFLNHEV